MKSTTARSLVPPLGGQEKDMFKYQTIIFICALVISSQRNSGSDNNKRELDSNTVESIDVEGNRVLTSDDTTLFFKLNKRQIPTILRKSDIKHYKGFQKYIDTHSPDSLSYSNLEIADVTGDAISDSCITKISLVSQIPFIEHKVISNGIQLFYDTLTLDYPIALFWNDDETSFNALKPYSGMFIAQTYFGKFVGDSVNSVNKNWSYFLYVLHKDEKEKWNSYLENYKGHWIWYLDVVDGGGMIWDSNSKKFIFFWGPG